MQLRTNYETFVVAIYSRKIRAYFNYFAHAFLFENFRIHVHPAYNKNLLQQLSITFPLQTISIPEPRLRPKDLQPQYTLLSNHTRFHAEAEIRLSRLQCSPNYYRLNRKARSQIVLPFVVKPVNTSQEAKYNADSSTHGSPKGTSTAQQNNIQVLSGGFKISKGVYTKRRKFLQINPVLKSTNGCLRELKMDGLVQQQLEEIMREKKRIKIGQKNMKLNQNSNSIKQSQRSLQIIRIEGQELQPQDFEKYNKATTNQACPSNGTINYRRPNLAKSLFFRPHISNFNSILAERIMK